MKYMIMLGFEFDLDSDFGDFSSSLDKEPQYASTDVIVVDGGGFMQSGDESDDSDEFGEFINHEEAQRMLLCPTSLQTAVLGSSAEKALHSNWSFRVTDSLSFFVVSDNCIMGMSVGQQITDIVGAHSISWALATSLVPLLSSSVDGLYLQAMITSFGLLHIPLKEEQLTDTASKSVEKCISLSKKFMPASQRVRVVVPADSNVVQVRRMSTSVNRTPAESASHSTSHSITPPPLSTIQPVFVPPSPHALPNAALEDPLPATPTIDAAQLRNQQAESVICSLPELKFMLSNELVI